MTVEMHIFAGKFLGTDEMASAFIVSLTNEGLLPTKIGLHEPVREPFDPRAVCRMWTQAKTGSNQVAGGMMARAELPKYTFSVSWAKGPNARPGYLYFLMPDKTFRSDADRFMNVFTQLFVKFGGLFGYISEESASNRQHVTGTVETRLPGLYWCTALSPQYVEFFGGSDRIVQGPWSQVHRLADGGILLFLAATPFAPQLVAATGLEDSGKAYLGADSFGDPRVFRANPRELQIRNVPALEMPEIREVGNGICGKG